jgi:hypothetical protein
MRRKITPQDTIPVHFSARERDLLSDGALLDPDLEAAVTAAPEVDDEFVAQYTLSDLDLLLGEIAAVANHAPRGKRRREFESLFARLSDLLDTYDDGM